ncbi:MAG: PAS domain S-box protein [Nitrospirae bacterium]|nr:PAS domain S-box protein [Nitrospirota bacterium]
MDPATIGLLEEEGYQVDVAQTSESGLIQLEQKNYRAVLLSIDQLDKDKLSVLHTLNQLDRQLPIVVLSAWDPQGKNNSEFHRYDVFEILTHPYEKKRLKTVVKRAVGVKYALQQVAEYMADGVIRSDARFRAVVQTATDAIILADGGGNILSWNKGAQTMFGYTPEEIVGQPLTCLMPPHYRPAHERGIERVKRTGEFRVVGRTVELHGLRKDGEEFPIELSLSGSVLETETFYCGIIRDITARKKAEQNLQESEQRFQLTIDNINDAVLYADLSGVVLWANQQCATIFDRPLNQIVGRSLMNCLSPEAASLAEARLALVRQGVAVPARVVFEVIRADGSSRWMEATASSVTRNETVVGRLLVGRDITERQRALDAHKKMCQEMEMTLGSLPGQIFIVERGQQVIYANPQACQRFGTKEFSLIGSTISEVLPFTPPEWNHLVENCLSEPVETREITPFHELQAQGRLYNYQLFPISLDGQESGQMGLILWDVTEQKKLQDQLIQSEKLNGLGTLVSGMMHEVRSPMQSIMGVADLLLEEENPETIKELAGDLKRVTRHITSILNDFLTYARPSSSESIMGVDIGERLINALKMVRRGPYFGTVEVQQEISPVPPISVRSGELDQVLINLLANAVQAMGGRGHLRLTTQHRDNAVTAQISDTGCGIPEEALGKIFEPFYSTKGNAKGTGLGLSIVQEIVHRYGGQIMVESTKGKGTTFTIRFPVLTES